MGTHVNIVLGTWYGYTSNHKPIAILAIAMSILAIAIATVTTSISIATLAISIATLALYL